MVTIFTLTTLLVRLQSRIKKMNKHKYQQPTKNDVLFEKKKRNPPISFCKFIAIVNKFF